jgi:hypothetical protein
MILHRLRLTSFRGVADREVAFPDHGVVVVCGPNEVGKSSMLEALDLLVKFKDRSGARDVKQVKPAHVDAGAEVEAEMSTGPYRFVYRKRFHKKQYTELEVISPRREQLTGEEAHQRVEAMLAETVDTRLWEAQRVLQSAATDVVDLSGSDALARALDAAAGAAQTAGSGTESLLIDRIEAEYLRYFTPTGRPARDVKAAAERLGAADDEVLRCRARVEEAEERSARHAELAAVLRDLEQRLSPAAARLGAARAAHAALGDLRDRLAQAELTVQAADAAAANTALANGQRQELIAERARRAGALDGLRAGLAEALAAEDHARAAAAAATALAKQAADESAAAGRRCDAARAAAQACLDREEADRLATRLQRLEDTITRIAEIDLLLAAIAIDEDGLSDLEEAAALVGRLKAQLQADGGEVEITAVADLEVTVEGEPHTLTGGQPWTRPATSAATLEVPGVLSVRIRPGATAVKLRADLTAAREVLADALAQAGVSGLAAARAAARQRRALGAERDSLAAAADVLAGGQDVGGLRATLAALRKVAPPGDADPQAAAAELAAADAAREAAGAAAAAHQRACTHTAAELAGISTQCAVLRDRVETAEVEVAEITAKLGTLRAAVADDAVAAAAAADAAALATARAARDELAKRCAEAGAEAVDAELAAAAAAEADLTAARDAALLELHTITAELGVMGGEGRQGELAAAEAGAERARAEHRRLGERAAAAALLRDTMMRHRDTTRQRYVTPYRTELERLGRAVFGDSFEVELDTGLTIRSRTLDGRTVPYESLSGGAKEQLGILARLAGAALVAADDTVPVVIDDALGFSDPARLQRMGTVFGTVGDRGQVIVLTCQPDRYSAIEGAQIIEVSA